MSRRYLERLMLRLYLRRINNSEKATTTVLVVLLRRSEEDQRGVPTRTQDGRPALAAGGYNTGADFNRRKNYDAHIGAMYFTKYCCTEQCLAKADGRDNQKHSCPNQFQMRGLEEITRSTGCPGV